MFRVGDYIKGKESSPYGYTNKDMTLAVVIDINESCYEDIVIRVLEHNDISAFSLREFEVCSEYFLKVNERG